VPPEPPEPGRGRRTEFAAEKSGDTDGIARFFAEVFAASAGAEEGRPIGDLVRNLLTTTPARDLHVFSCRDDGALAGCIVLSRLVYDRDPRTVFMLSPVAVETGRQGQGVGQALLRYGLNEMGQHGVDVAVTYGNPQYYARVGFMQVSQDVAPAPQPLSHPEGWLAQSLAGRPLTPLRGRPRCAKAFDDPGYW